MSETNSDLRAENERLLDLNHRLSQQVINMSATLEAGRRELLAAGWDAGYKAGLFAIEYNGAQTNPYRQPVPDFTGAIICKMGDDQ